MKAIIMIGVPLQNVNDLTRNLGIETQSLPFHIFGGSSWCVSLLEILFDCVELVFGDTNAQLFGRFHVLPGQIVLLELIIAES